MFFFVLFFYKGNSFLIIWRDKRAHEEEVMYNFHKIRSIAKKEIDFVLIH